MWVQVSLYKLCHYRIIICITCLYNIALYSAACCACLPCLPPASSHLPAAACLSYACSYACLICTCLSALDVGFVLSFLLLLGGHGGLLWFLVQFWMGWCLVALSSHILYLPIVFGLGSSRHGAHGGTWRGFWQNVFYQFSPTPCLLPACGARAHTTNPRYLFLSPFSPYVSWASLFKGGKDTFAYCGKEELSLLPFQPSVAEKKNKRTVNMREKEKEGRPSPAQ